jgi:multicomponent Na+:H+ antiporter subunit G
MNVITIVLLALGLFFFAVGVVGILRLPDFYTRMHAAGKCDTLASELVLLAVALYNLSDPSLGSVLVSIKIMMIAGFVFVASPTATHALTEAALVVGVSPWSKNSGRRRL